MISASAEKTVPGSAAAGVSAEPLFASSATPSIISCRFHCWPLYRRFRRLRGVQPGAFDRGASRLDGERRHQDPVRKEAGSLVIGYEWLVTGSAAEYKI